MKNTTIVVAGGALIVGLLLGYGIAPKMFGNGPMRGAQNIDAHFIEQMIPHHEGAIAMAEEALTRTSDERVKSLARGIIEAQTGEISMMEQWYQDWYGRAPVESMGHGGMHMQGMEGDVDALRSATDFDQEFLSQMIVHHEAAIMMAQMLESGTERSQMKELADQIITSQTREIAMMRSWLAGE